MLRLGLSFDVPLKLYHSCLIVLSYDCLKVVSHIVSWLSHLMSQGDTIAMKGELKEGFIIRRFNNEIFNDPMKINFCFEIFVKHKSANSFKKWN